jgi:hypothetical protein
MGSSRRLGINASQMDGFHRVVDRVHRSLCPQDGLVGIVDFYTDGKQYTRSDKAGEGSKRKLNLLSSWFWQIFFDFDHVSAVQNLFILFLTHACLQVCLSPNHRAYLEHKFGRVRKFDLAIFFIDK